MSIPKYKVALIGYTNVGKTSFVTRTRNGKFERKHKPTMGVEVHPVTFNLKNIEGVPNKACLNFWDCAGEEKYLGLDDVYWTGSKAVFIMFSHTCKKSFEEAEKRIEQVRNKLGNEIPIVLIGNKFDVPVEQNKVRSRKARELAERTSCTYFPFSVKSCHNIEEPVLVVLRHYLDREITIE